MKKRDIDIEILRQEVKSLKHLVAEIKKDFTGKETEEFVLSQTPTDEEQQIAALNKEIMRREHELKQLVAQSLEAEEHFTPVEAPAGAVDAMAAATPEDVKPEEVLTSSETMIVKQPEVKAAEPAIVSNSAAEETETAELPALPQQPKRPEIKRSPEFLKLADPQLPALPMDDRARLQLQSPNRLFFYWSSRQNPYENLQRLFGERFRGYDLAVRLINLKDDSIRVMPADMSGTTWFDVGSDAEYRAELGFFSQSRPFIRVMYSNTIQTPRASPSRRLASDADFAVRTVQFADVLTASGFAHENVAQDFAFADRLMADTRAREIAARITEDKPESKTLKSIDLAELRWVLVSLAAYIPLDELKQSISPELVTWLEQIEAENPQALHPENIAAELKQTLGEEFVEMVKSGEVETRKRYVHKVFGGSAVEVFETFVPQLVDFPEPAEKKKYRHEFDRDFPTSPANWG